MAIFIQLEKLDSSDIKVMAVMTHEGSGLGSCERNLKKICTGATFGKGLAAFFNCINQTNQHRIFVNYLG